jgi:hypothetical protein
MEPVDADRTKLARWFMHLATKGIDELILVNRPFPLRGCASPPRSSATPLPNHVLSPL